MENKTRTVNNDFYHDLGKTWHEGQDHPIALLRAEARLKNPWVVDVLRNTFSHPVTVLDIGCGGGILSNHLAQSGFDVVGVDLSKDSLRVATECDMTQSVKYLQADAHQLPFSDQRFDAVCCLDVLEHLEDPGNVILEASRVLKPGGVFLFHTFNRTWLSALLAVHAIPLFFKNAPKDLHVYSHFITPRELDSYCEEAHLEVEFFRGIYPKLTPSLIWNILRTRCVPDSLQFGFCDHLKVGYVGVAEKRTYAAANA